MNFKFVDKDQLRKKVTQSGHGIPDQLMVSVGDDIEDRWLVTNKKFRPLHDLLAISKDPGTVDLHNRLRKTPELQQFVLAPELAYEATVLSNQLSTDFDAVQRLMPKVMPPYHNICVELPITAQVQARRLAVEPGQLQLRRVGAHIKTVAGADKTLMFGFVPYYEFTNGSVCASPIDLYYTQNNDVLPVCHPIKMLNFDMLWNATYSPWVWKRCAQLGQAPETAIAALQSDAFVAASNEAMEEVPVLFFAWLALINSKSGITPAKVHARVAPSHLGKRQRFKRGRSEYTVLCLSDMEIADSAGVVSPKPQVSAHRVRGHFKARKRGVFWWRPHVRGVGELREREAYVVQS